MRWGSHSLQLFFFFFTKHFPVCYGEKQSPGEKEAAVLGWWSICWSSELSTLWELEQQNPREKFVVFLLKKSPWLGGVLLGTSFKRELDEEFIWFTTFRGSTVGDIPQLSSQSFVLPMHSPGSDSARWAPKASHHRLPGWQSLYHIPRVGSLWLSESCALAQGSYYPTLFSSPIFHRSQTCIVSWEFFLLLLTLPFEFHSFTLFFKYLFICLFLYLAVLGLSWGTQDLRLHCVPWTLSCAMQDLVPQPGIEPRPPALGVQSLSHWTIREVVIVLL